MLASYEASLQQTLAFDEHGTVNAYSSTPLPNGSIAISGSSGGLSFPMNVHQDNTFSMFDASFNRPLNVSFTGDFFISSF